MDIQVVINNEFREVLNGKILSLKIEDNICDNLDSLSLIIDNSDLTFEVPSNKGTIELILDNTKMGIFNLAFIENTSSSIIIQAISQDLTKGRERYNRVFKNKGLKDILQTLATSLGVSLNLDNTLNFKQINYFLQDNKTDLEVMLELAEIYYSIANIKNNELVFISRSKPQVPFIIEGDSSILDITREEKSNKTYNGVKAEYWNFKEAKVEEITLGEKPYLNIENIYEEALLKELVIAKNKELQEQDFIELEVEGNPQLQAGFNLQLVNMEIYKDFVGNYKITKATHNFDGSFYKTLISAYKL